MMKTALFLGMLAITVMVGCASTDTPRPRGVEAFADDPRLGEKVDRICFNSTIDSFSDNRRDTVVLHKNARDEYLVEVSGGCPDLDQANSIGIDSTSNCVGRNDYLIVSRSAFSLNDNGGLGPQRCSIRAIYKWHKDAEAEDKGS